MQPKDWLLHMAARLQGDSETIQQGLRIIAYFLWVVWKERNDCHFQQRNPQPLATSIRIKASMAISEDHEPQRRAPLPSITRSYRVPWINPPLGTLKLNVYATFFQSSKKGMIALVIKDEHGSTVPSHSRSILSSEPLVAEGLAIREALLLAMNLELRKVYICSDNLKLVSLIREHRYAWSVYSMLRDIQTFRNSFRTCGFFWVPRQSNQQAHNAARSAYNRIHGL